MDSQQYKEKKIEQRRLLRKHKTKAESIVWKLLRNRGIGFKFRRQYGIGRYIVDFYCPEQKLIVEIDGSSHEHTYKQDKQREKFLIANGYRIIRYQDGMVLNNPDGVKDDIIKICSAPSPQPSPSKGEGAIVSAIAAIGENRELGKNGKIPWHIPEDFAHFKKITSGHPVIMGRKTFESIGKPLPGRTNIIVTRNTDYQAAGCIVVDSIEKAIEEAKKHPASSAGKDQEEIFVIGGGEIYKQAMPYIDKLYLTMVKGSFEADTFFPDYKEFSQIVQQTESRFRSFEVSFLELTR